MSGFTGAFSPKGNLEEIDCKAFRPSLSGRCRRDEVQEAPYFRAVREWHEAFQAIPKAAASADGKVRLFLEGELFNLDELRTSAEQSPAAHCLTLYLEDRLDELARVNGSFALLVVDALPRPRLSLVTDRLSTRPIYVFHKENRCFFSTDMASLLSFSQVERRLSLQGVVEFFAFRRTSLDRTLYEGIRAVPPATVWSFDGYSPKVSTYWRMRWKGPPCGRKEAPEALAEKLGSAVRRRIEGGGRCALLLSGGLDARAVLAASVRPLKTLTMAPFDNAEARAARRLAEANGSDHGFIHVPPERVAAGFPSAVAFCGGNYLPPFNLFPAAQEIAAHCDVALSGYGIDYTIRGMYMNNRFLRLGGSLTQLPWLRRASNGGLEDQIAETLRYRLSAESLQRVFSRRLAAECEARLRESIREALALHDSNGFDPQNGWDSYTLSPLSKHYTFVDLLFLRHFVETRTPAYDRDLFDFFLSMPPSWRCSGKVFREALQVLNPSLARMPTSNTGFRADLPLWPQVGLVLSRAALQRAGLIPRAPVPQAGATQGSWVDFPELLRTHSSLKGQLDEALRDPELRRLEIFDMESLQAMVREDRAHAADHGKALMLFLTFATWSKLLPFSDVVRHAMTVAQQT
ncbi:MAG: asparagine synthase-related protein [Nitrospinota bacterium]